MQETQAIPHWAFTVLQWLALFGAGGTCVKLIMLYQNRKKPGVEVNKTEAETTEITIRSHSSASDSLMRMMGKLEAAQATNDRLRSERNKWKEEAQSLKSQAEVDQYFIKRLVAANELGITLKKLDEIERDNGEG